MSLKPLTLGLLGSITLSGGLAVAAHAAGQAIKGGAEGLATLLVGSGPSREARVNSRELSRRTPSATSRGEPPSRTAGTTRQRRDPIAAPSRAAPPTSAVAGGTNHASQGFPKLAQAPSAGAGFASAPSRLPRVTPPRRIRLSTDAPICGDVYVYIVSIFDNVGDSMATLALDAKARGRQRRVGQRLGRYEVIGIGYNTSRVSSAVWLADGSRVCQALVRDVNPAREKPVAAAAQRKARVKQAKRRRATRNP